MTSRATIGYTAVAKNTMATNQGFANLICKERINPEYLAFWLEWHRDQFIRLAGGTTFREISKTTLKKVAIPLPSLEEQRRIVGILNRAAKIERLRTQTADRLREFIPALFVKMFGDPAENPMGWETAPLGKVCVVVGGGTPRRSNNAYFSGPIPWATPTDVTALAGLAIEKTRETLTETGLGKSSARLVPAGAVLLTSRATIGFTAIAAVPMATNQGFANLICGERLIPEFLAIWLRLRRDRLIQLAGGSTFKEISKSTLKKIEIPVPPLERQYRFGRVAARASSFSCEANNTSRVGNTLYASLINHLL